MLKDKLAEYLKRNDLSKKAVNEILAILEDYDYSSDDSIVELVETLYTFKPDVIYAFACKSLNNIPDEKIGLFVELCQKSININKITHAFCLAIALFKQSKKVEAETIVCFFVKNFLFGKKTDKRIFKSFEKALHYEGSEYLIDKLIIEDDRIKNGYRNLLIGFLEMYPKSEYANAVKAWFSLNKVVIHSSEQEIISSALKTGGNEHTDTDVISDDRKEDKGESNDTETVPVQSEKQKAFSEKISASKELLKVPVTQLLEAVNAQVLQLYEKISILETENKKLKENAVLMSENLKSCGLSLKNEQNTISSLRGEIVIRDKTIADLRRENVAATASISGLSKEVEELNGKLSNVESAYGNAGQQEIEYLKGQIRKRLASEYSKYTELKEKAPDLDYYNILLDMLDEIYYVLGKNGIKFD